MLPEENLKDYTDNFLKNTIEYEFFVDKQAESDLMPKFLKLLANHNLLKSIGMNK